MEENNSVPSITKSSHSQMWWTMSTVWFTHTQTKTKYFGQWQCFCVQLHCHCTNKFSIMLLCLQRHNNNNNNNNNNNMADKCRPVCRNRGLSNSNTGPSHTKKKLQEIYFEAAKHWCAVQKKWKRIGDDPAHYCIMWATSIYRICKKTWQSSKSYSPETGRSSWIDWRQKSILYVHTS